MGTGWNHRGYRLRHKELDLQGWMRVWKVQPGTDIIFPLQDNQFQDSVAVESGTTEEKIYNGSDTSDDFRLKDTVNDRGEEGYHEDKIWFLKALRIDDESADWVWHRDYPALLTVQPQGGTFRKWKPGTDHL